MAGSHQGVPEKFADNRGIGNGPVLLVIVPLSSGYRFDRSKEHAIRRDGNGQKSGIFYFN